MSINPSLTSAFSNTKNRSSILSSSGMCSFCTEDCLGTCELGLAAVLGSQTVYPTTTGNNQIASEKTYPIDFSQFNINGRVFGAQGVAENYEDANIFNVNLERSFGYYNPIKISMPILLPALIKLNWKDYFAGAAMAGVCCVIGEGSTSKDENVKFENGKVVKFEMLGEILDSFRKYYRGYGQIILQCNVEDDMNGLAEYGILNHGLEAIEFKFGQSAKGVQPARIIKGGYKEALEKQKSGLIVRPDPSSEEIINAYKNDCCPNFYAYDRLPLYDLEYLSKRISDLRDIGMKNVYFKMAGYDKKDIEKVLEIATQLKVDMVTFDGAGGGSGYSPCKMMNEWSLPTVALEKVVSNVVKELKKTNEYIPAITITGGIASEDQVFKVLAMGEKDVTCAGICRAAMAAAMSSKKVGEMIEKGIVPAMYKNYGTTVEEIFTDLNDLKYIYGKNACEFSTGAIGVFSYLNKIAFGLKHFCALNRKFDVNLLGKEDLIPLTIESKELLK